VSVSAVVELRQYTLLPGMRETLIDLFEANLVEGQEETGMKIIGTFRDLDDQTKFVWLRGFANMDARAQSLADFYDGPVWQQHRDVANSTMVDSDDVLLLRPARSDTGFAPVGERPPPDALAHAGRDVVEAAILSFDAPPGGEALAYFDREIAPRLAAAGASMLACLVTEDSPNNFPALPVREGEHVLAWFAGYNDHAAYDACRHARVDLLRAAAHLPRLVATPRVLRLAPTRRSYLTGSARAAIDGR
jgi:hypothetical protein